MDSQSATTQADALQAALAIKQAADHALAVAMLDKTTPLDPSLVTAQQTAQVAYSAAVASCWVFQQQANVSA